MTIGLTCSQRVQHMKRDRKTRTLEIGNEL